ncbi:ABC transporter substrate-binding protein [Aeromicrobium choanae]|uniref:Iron complex transport system substrate-binding protein n=1 Tax=Aeromicrobium choanae TaxID=1736691 RepID=A0A1T4YS87_9ACTN|nr:ABC transporter substrate-binding protein [Aeromicrobium choanae]SKB04596.1 iron complex transport system substrate-binding protein [Aeromicrobium choanae]
MSPFRRTTLPTRVLATLLLSSVALAACAGAPESDASAAAASDHYPVTVENCGVQITYDAAPSRAVSIFQGATEVMLSLGLQDHMIGTTGLDDAVADRWKEPYDAIDVLGDGALSREELLKHESDFAYASYISAFDADKAGDRDELKDLGVASYVSESSCIERKDQTPASFDKIWKEVGDIATIFDAEKAARSYIADEKKRIADISAEQAGEGLTVFWYDSETKSPYTGAGTGAPQLIIETVGATNAFADVKGTWDYVPWEDVVDADPDVIVLADAEWSTAKEKIDFLRKDPALSRLTAVRSGAFVTLPFSETTPGVRVVDGAQHMSEQLEALDLDR